jgi:hypothetical protein
VSSTITEQARARASAVERFLETRGLTIAAVEDVIRGALDEPAVVLLTSSPVHGLANRLSDIDTICIVEGDEDDDGRIATQLFAAGNHLEYICLSRSSLERDLEHLRQVASLASSDAVAAYDSWNSSRTVRLKYVERIVNGVATDGTMPFADRLPDLGTVWKWSSLERATRLAAYAILAERAGEDRGRLAYAANATLFAMDAVLSHHGSVCGNRKWFLLRWDRFRRTRHSGEPPLSTIEDTRAALYRIPGQAPLVDTLARMVAEVSNAVGGSVGALACRPVAGARELPLLPGGSLIVAPDGRAVPAAEGLLDSEFETSLAALGELDAESAAALLRRVRADVQRLVVWP